MHVLVTTLDSDNRPDKNTSGLNLHLLFNRGAQVCQLPAGDDVPEQYLGRPGTDAGNRHRQLLLERHA
jgi:hypothetical protein